MYIYIYNVYIHIFIYIYILAGGFKPSEKYQSLRMIIPNIWKNKTCSLRPPCLSMLHPAYPLTGSNPCAGFNFFTFQNNKHGKP